jgi:protein-tyrosine-phosphatase
MPSPQKVRVLFVCVGNACRSPMAESIARKIASDILEPTSAGLYPLGSLPETTVQTLLTNNCSFDGLYSKPLRREAMEDADLIINMSGGPLEYDFHGHTNENPALARKVENWKIADPYGENAATYQKIFEELESRIVLLAGRLRTAQQTTSL